MDVTEFSGMCLCVLVHADPAASATSGNERRKSWQSYTRLKQASAAAVAAAAATSYRPRTLATNQSWTTALLTPSSASVAARSGATSPPTTDDAGATTHATLTATLSPIASGSSSMSYAPKSSASTCGGTAVGGAVPITPDESCAADALISHEFLLQVDQQLQHINSYVNILLYSCLSICL